MTQRPTPRWVPALAVAGAVGVALYVTSWVVAGLWREGYDPLRQAISETFEQGAPTGPRTLVLVGLVVSGLALAAFGPVLHRGLPGRSLAGPVLATASGVLTVGAAVFPCSAGCPGLGTTTTDTWHVIFAGGGYLALILAPLATGVRVRGHLPRFARLSFLLGGLALAGFLIRNGFLDAYGGLQQRIFNTLADLWYLIAAVVIVRRAGFRSYQDASTTASGPSERTGLRASGGR